MLSWLWQGLRTTVLPLATTESDTTAIPSLRSSSEPELGSWVRGGTKKQRTARPKIVPTKTRRAKVNHTTAFTSRVTTRSAAKSSDRLRPFTGRCVATRSAAAKKAHPQRNKATRPSITAATTTNTSPKIRCCVPPRPLKPKRIVSTTSTISTITISTDEESNTKHERQSARPRADAAPQTKKRPLVVGQPLPSRRRRRGVEGAIEELANHIVQSRKVVFISGAGLSVASGIRPFRSNPKAELPPGMLPSDHVLHAGLWNEVLWSMATRENFRKNPAKFYNEFWIPHFLSETQHQPNAGHDALQRLMDEYPETVKQVTQNIDGLQKPRERQLVEVHGRVGLFKCCPDEDSDSEDEDDDDDDDSGDRPVQLGDRRRSRLMREGVIEACPYQFQESLTNDQLILCDSDPGLRARGKLTRPPCCPACGNHVMPQSLLFDEGYHSHSFYEFEKAEEWLTEAEVLVFVGTSLGAVRLTRVALEYAREKQLPCYNFNVFDTLESTSWLNASNIMGDATETLPMLVEACRRL